MSFVTFVIHLFSAVSVCPSVREGKQCCTSIVLRELSETQAVEAHLPWNVLCRGTSALAGVSNGAESAQPDGEASAELLSPGRGCGLGRTRQSVEDRAGHHYTLMISKGPPECNVEKWVIGGETHFWNGALFKTLRDALTATQSPEGRKPCMRAPPTGQCHFLVAHSSPARDEEICSPLRQWRVEWGTMRPEPRRGDRRRTVKYPGQRAKAGQPRRAPTATPTWKPSVPSLAGLDSFPAP